jgi:hypothetical protein
MTLLATDDGIRLYCEDLADEMNALDVPTLVAAGDDDDPCLEPLVLEAAYQERRPLLAPNTGHALNLEEPDLFNRCCDDFFHRLSSSDGRAEIRGLSSEVREARRRDFSTFSRSRCAISAIVVRKGLRHKSASTL